MSAGDPNGSKRTRSSGFAQRNKMRSLLHSLLRKQQRRVQSVEARLHQAEARQASQSHDLEILVEMTLSEQETRLLEAVNALTMRMEAVETWLASAELQSASSDTCSEDENAPPGMYQQAWRAAPLTLRLKFIADLLPTSHPAQSVLKEAGALEELRRRGRDLESWLTNYPTLFAEAAQVLETGVRACKDTSSGETTHDADILAAHTLQEAWDILETTLQASGVTWIAPLPGETVTLEHEVIGEEAVEQPAGSVARLRRRGFRAQGRLALPAQVLRAIPLPDAALQSAPATQGSHPAADHTMASSTAALQVANTASTPTIPGGLELETNSSNVPAPETAENPSAWQAPSEIPDTTQSEQDDEHPIVVTRAASLSDSLVQADTEGHVNGKFPSEAEVSGKDMSLPAGDLPDWQRLLIQQTYRCDVPAVRLLVEQILAASALPDQVAAASSEVAARRILTDTLLPLLPVLGLRFAEGLPEVPAVWGQVLLDARPHLLSWLEAHLAIRLISPQRGTGFDGETMDASETRRTVHADEDETVARMERVGLLWNGAPLLRAQVVRYAAGGNA